MTKYYLAVDGGGTKTEAVCADSTGAVVGRGLAGPTNLTSTSVGAASFNLIEAIRQAVETLPEADQNGFPVLVMGLAGLDSQAEHDMAYRTFTRAVAHYGIADFVLVNDSIIALENGTSNPNALIVISGTGSICFGRNAAGATARASGMDYLLSDQGSGYAIGRRVLREAVKSFDGRAAKSILEEMVCTHFHLRTIADLKTAVYHPQLTKIEVAELAPLCTKAFDAGDAVAQEIFQKTVREIGDMIQAVTEKINLIDTEYDLVLAGSVTAVPQIREAISVMVRKQFPTAKIVTPKSEPVFGALQLAIQKGAEKRTQGN